MSTLRPARAASAACAILSHGVRTMPQVKPIPICRCSPLVYDQSQGLIPGRRCRSPRCIWALKNNPRCRCGHTYSEHAQKSPAPGSDPLLFDPFARQCNAMMPGYDRREAILQAASDIVKSTCGTRSGNISPETLKRWCPCIRFCRPGKPHKHDPARVARQRNVHARVLKLREANVITTRK